MSFLKVMNGIENRESHGRDSQKVTAEVGGCYLEREERVCACPLARGCVFLHDLAHVPLQAEGAQPSTLNYWTHQHHLEAGRKGGLMHQGPGGQRVQSSRR